MKHNHMIHSLFVKVRVSVPLEAADQVREAMGVAGAGIQGNYAHCSFSVQGVGRFVPLAGAHPSVGTIGQVEQVVEELIEMLCHEDLVKTVVEAIKSVHPYEEPAIDIIPRFELE